LPPQATTRLGRSADTLKESVLPGSSTLSQVLRVTFGFILIGVGVLGLVLPVLPGIVLIFAGLAVMGKDSWLGRKVHDWTTSLRRAYSQRWRRKQSTE
jgi:uncharacterized membrane protein YbaN (DUF454 family)